MAQTRLETGTTLDGFLIAWTLVRWGPLALGTAWFTHLLLVYAPLRADPAQWYAPQVVLTWVLVLGLAYGAFRVSLGGRSPLGRFGAEF